MEILLAFLFIIIVDSVGEDAVFHFIGSVLGCGYGILCIAGFIAVCYGIYAWLTGK